MSKRSSKKSKRRSKALPALGFAGVSLSMAGGACASTSEASANTPPTSQPQELVLGEEEIFDTSLSTFYTFDKENAGQTSLAQHLKLARGGCGGCGHGGGCGCGHGGGCGGCGHGGGCAGFHGGCGGFGGCRCGGFRFRGCGCGGCGGCGCGICWTWPWVGWCWGQSTPPAEVASVASEQSTQTAEVAVRNIDRTRAK
jgi:hypothetical protein